MVSVPYFNKLRKPVGVLAPLEATVAAFEDFLPKIPRDYEYKIYSVDESSERLKLDDMETDGV